MADENKINGATLGEIAEYLNTPISGNEEIKVFDVTHDSRQAKENGLFVAIKGFASDGHRFIEDVLRRGAVGIISEQNAPEGFQAAWLKVKNARVALAKAANIINGKPSHEIKLVGITGTNGKTTTTYLVNALANAASEKSAMLTTVEYRIGDKSEPAVRTTPEASDTQRFFREAIEENCTVGTMETSSQALDLHRCDDLRFQVAIFTNLTRDHLDYHGTMENYFDAKKMLFDGRLGEIPNSSVINIDDEYGLKLAGELKEKGQKVVTFAQNSNADLTAENLEVSLIKGTKFLLKTPSGNVEVISPLVGKPHVYNILSATAAALELGFPLEKIVAGIETCVGAPGRFERVLHTGDFAVVVDYAHTDDALLNTLKTAKDLNSGGRIITVFGCGGDRDRSKRAPMGEIAGTYSDLAVLTSDNPRTENPLTILEEIEIGIKKTNCPFLKISDRREAIFTAIQKAKTGDVVIIAGKGHETYQIIGNDKFHFDDKEVAQEALAKKFDE